MGLDMWFEAFPANVTEEVLNSEEKPCEGQEVAYFRKHSDLHGWLTEKWLERHPEETDFNTSYMEITPELLSQMADYANQSEHEHHQGFFWGQSYDSDWERTKEVCEQIKDILDEGRKVFYYSWW